MCRSCGVCRLLGFAQNNFAPNKLKQTTMVVSSFNRGWLARTAARVTNASESAVTDKDLEL